jgi:hypothetical protein
MKLVVVRILNIGIGGDSVADEQRGIDRHCAKFCTPNFRVEAPDGATFSE